MEIDNGPTPPELPVATDGGITADRVGGCVQSVVLVPENQVVMSETELNIRYLF